MPSSVVAFVKKFIIQFAFSSNWIFIFTSWYWSAIKGRARLFTVADILQKRKNKDDDYEFEDFPDTREQYATGKYDSNFDALGSEFERAHSYDLNNVKQPENTESDIDFSD